MPEIRKKSITRGIIYAFVILLVVYGIHIIFATRAMHTLSEFTRIIHNHPLVVSNASLQATTNIIKIHRNMKDVVLLEDSNMINSTLDEVKKIEEDTFTQLHIVRKNIIGNEGMQLVSEALIMFKQWQPIRGGVIANVENGNRYLAALTTRAEGAAHVAKLEAKMRELTDYARNKASGFLMETGNIYTNVRNGSFALFILWGLLFLGVAVSTIKRTLLGERALSDERKKLNVTLHSIGDGVIATDQHGRITLLNEVAEQLTGWSEAEARGQSIEKVFNIINEITRVPCENPISKVISTGAIIGLANHTVLIAKDGTERAIADSGAPIRNDEQEIIGVILVFRDQTEEKYYQDELLRNEEKYRLLSDNTLDVIWTMNLDLKFTYINRAVTTFTGHTPDEWLGSPLSAHCDTKNFAIAKDIFDREITRGIHGKGVLFELDMVKKDGEKVAVEIRGKVIFDATRKPIGLQGVTRDISDRKSAERRRESLEKQLVQAQRLESIGRLAGGVAHDFNNMLSVILGYSELMLKETDADSSKYEDLLEIQAAARHSTNITRQLLAFARQQTVTPRVIDLNDTVENLLKMLRRLIGEDIDLAWCPGNNLSAIKIDPTQVDQIVANLCVNARDAINGVGTVTVATENVSFDEEFCKDRAGFVPGDYVLLSLSDDGCGMDTATQENIFEPFFTTKDTGSGTGLGLATVYGIVKQNNGFINVYSEPGKGTTFKIYLTSHEGERTRSIKTLQNTMPRGNGETLLLVEDEVAILTLGKRMLEQLGYTVIEAGSPEKAIELAGSHQGMIDLLITDVVMPGMNGNDLANHLTDSHHDLKVLFMSGYTADAIAHRGVLDSNVSYMQKPFSQDTLATKVRNTLNT